MRGGSGMELLWFAPLTFASIQFFHFLKELISFTTNSFSTLIEKLFEKRIYNIIHRWRFYFYIRHKFHIVKMFDMFEYEYKLLLVGFNPWKFKYDMKFIFNENKVIRKNMGDSLDKKVILLKKSLVQTTS